MKDYEGTIYLVHFERPYHHARHYVGWTQNEEVRIDTHRNGQGSPLLAAVQAVGIAYTVARRWRVTRKHERFIKDQKRTPLYCPICSERPASPKIEGLMEVEARI